MGVSDVDVTKSMPTVSDQDWKRLIKIRLELTGGLTKLKTLCHGLVDGQMGRRMDRHIDKQTDKWTDG